MRAGLIAWRPVDNFSGGWSVVSSRKNGFSVLRRIRPGSFVSIRNDRFYVAFATEPLFFEARMIDSEVFSDLSGTVADIRPEEETPPATEQAPKRRPRRSRKAPSASPEEEIKTEEQPTEPGKTGRSTRARSRKATAAETVPAPEAAETVSPQNAEEKPKRQRRTRRTKAEAASSGLEESRQTAEQGNESLVLPSSLLSADSPSVSEQPLPAAGAENLQPEAPTEKAASPVMSLEGERQAIAMAVLDIPAVAQPMMPAVSTPSPVPALLEKEAESSVSVENPVSGERADVPEGGTSKKRRSRRGRRRPSLSPEELAALAEDSPVPDYVSDDDDDEDVPQSSSAEIAPEEPSPAPEKRSRRSRRGRRRSGPETVIEKQDSEPEELGEDQTVMLPTDVLEELMADVLERAPITPEVKQEESVKVAEEGSEAVEASPDSEADSEGNSESRSRSRRTRGKKKASVEETADGNETEEEARKSPSTPRKMLISVLPGEQVEVVLTEDGQVREYYVEMAHQAKIRGNIYKGVINNIDTNLQAAFVNYGNVKNGFLQIDEVHPEYYLQPYEPAKGRKYPPIQKVLKTGQEVLVQVVKEPNGSKGAFLTTWVSLAGRFLVLTPGQEQIGISRKVEDPEERNRLRELIKGLDPGEGLGAIVRTVSAGTSKTTLQKDLNFLKRVWKDIRKRATTEKSPALIYQEPGLASRSVRDYLSDDVTEVWVDDEVTAVSIREMATLLFPRKADLVHLYTDHKKTLWEHFNVLSQLEQVHAREVTMPSGGRLVFDQTEALMAIDINSGKIGGKTNFEAMAYRTNMEAARAIAQQLRLRDIGGQIVIDFIEMRDPEHCRDVEKEIRNAMKNDRARHDIGKMSSFGLLQIVRQRTGSSAISISMEPCPHCNGTGQRRTMEWQALQALRALHCGLRSAAASGQPAFLYTVRPELGLYLLNHKRERLSEMEKEFHTRIEIRIDGISPALPATPEKNGGKQS